MSARYLLDATTFLGEKYTREVKSALRKWSMLRSKTPQMIYPKWVLEDFFVETCASFNGIVQPNNKYTQYHMMLHVFLSYQKMCVCVSDK